MSLYKHNGDLPLPERRGIIGVVVNSFGQTEPGSRVFRRGKRFGRIIKPSFLIWVLLSAGLFLITFALLGLKILFSDNNESGISTAQEVRVGGHGLTIATSIQEVGQETSGSIAVRTTNGKKRKKHFPCEVTLSKSVDYIIEPKDIRNFTNFALEYVVAEEKPPASHVVKFRFGGQQTFEERDKSFSARNQTLHCGFVKESSGPPTPGFDLAEKDKAYMSTCKVAVSSCIFGSSDFLRRPTSKKMSDFSKQNVCFVMFVDEQTLSKLASEGHIPDDRGHIGLWKMVIVRNLPYEDMRRTGKVPKFLSHRLFPASWYSIWIDSKMRLATDPLLIIEYFLWRSRSEYAISNHYDRHCVWEEVLQNKRLNKYDPRAIDEQFNFYQSDGLTKFDPSDPSTLLPSYVPEGSFIVRAHTPMSNLFSCLWFNEVDRFTSRDQLSFAYTYLKLRRRNPDLPFYLNMFKVTYVTIKPRTILLEQMIIKVSGSNSISE
ncbi:hypothetical protein K2173_006408 [Erythroxylum novogranatense]|uniref:TOD1/MUCI70 glycosyltransferase-like domain-containing protein n=1 Tax=Erythroxylum novogranatense TaxID=1862640 RepID=A0AAV8U3H6_9ROSI|nr:hypothetical protein K2173_006408 [Erythroxylum novogranatense]